MKKKLNGRLSLSKETLRTLVDRETAAIQGGIHTDLCTTGQSNITDTCDTCLGPSCRNSCNNC